MVESYKERQVDASKPVQVYRCLPRKGRVFSVRQEGLVVGHTEEVVLKDCKFKVNKSGHKRYLREKQRNVHAFIEGYLGQEEDIQNKFSFDLMYDLTIGEFTNSVLGPVREASTVKIDEKGVYFQL